MQVVLPRDGGSQHACCSALVAQQHRIRMQDLNILAPVLPLTYLANWGDGVPPLAAHLRLQTEREEGKVPDQDGS